MFDYVRAPRGGRDRRRHSADRRRPAHARRDRRRRMAARPAWRRRCAAPRWWRAARSRWRRCASSGCSRMLVAPEPNTWRELLATLDAAAARRRQARRRAGVRRHQPGADRWRSAPAAPRCCACRSTAGRCRRISVRCTTPSAPSCDGRVDVALFTSATQVYHLFQVAAPTLIVARRLRHVLIASIGPICSEALREHGLAPDLEPEQAKMGQLVREVALRGPALLAQKRAAHSAGV